MEQHCHLQATETKTPQARKKSHRSCWVFAQRTRRRGCEKFREMPVRTRERKGISRLHPAPHLRPNHPWTASRPRNRSSRGRKSGCPGGSGAWWAGLHSDWLVLGLRAATQGGRCQCPGPGRLGVFSGTLFGTEGSPLKNLSGDVRVLSPTAEASHVRERCKSPVRSPPSHPRPVNAFLPVAHSLFSQPSLF